MLWSLSVLAAAYSFASIPPFESGSPDSQWLVVSHCEDTADSDSCTVVLSRRADGKVFFTHQTFPRYIKAVWSSDSRRCLLLDAPDNANSYLWLFRVKGREIATEQVDYKKISAAIEAAVPATRRREPAVTRSGIEKVEWASTSQLRLHVI